MPRPDANLHTPSLTAQTRTTDSSSGLARHAFRDTKMSRGALGRSSDSASNRGTDQAQNPSREIPNHRNRWCADRSRSSSVPTRVSELHTALHRSEAGHTTRVHSKTRRNSPRQKNGSKRDHTTRPTLVSKRCSKARTKCRLCHLQSWNSRQAPRSNRGSHTTRWRFCQTQLNRVAYAPCFSIEKPLKTFLNIYISLLVPKCINWIQLCSTSRRINSKNNTNQ